MRWRRLIGVGERQNWINEDFHFSDFRFVEFESFWLLNIKTRMFSCTTFHTDPGILPFYVTVVWSRKVYFHTAYMLLIICKVVH